MSSAHDNLTNRTAQIAIVGAGLSGLACAKTLTEHGYKVCVFDKARAPAGRMSTRRIGQWAFDHGAQYFTVRDPVFRRFLQSCMQQDLVQPWLGEVVRLASGDVGPTESKTERFVGVPGMSALAQHLAKGLEVTAGFEVASVQSRDGALQVVGVDGSLSSRFDVVVVSAPGPQAAVLTKDVAPRLAEVAAGAQFAPCLATMLAFDRELPLPFDGAFVAESPLSWVARNSAKPGRAGGETWVLHGSPSWSLANLDEDASVVIQAMIRAFAQAIGRPVPAPEHATMHRWRYALPTEPLAERCIFDPEVGVGACGDWCGGPRVEGAFLSGVAMAQAIVKSSTGESP